MKTKRTVENNSTRKKKNVCEDCGVLDESVEYTIDPYNNDLCDKEIWVWLCTDCYNNIVECI